MAEQEFLTISQTAEILGITPRGARKLAEHGRLPAFRDGRRWRISRRGLDELHARATSRAFAGGLAPELAHVS